MLGDTRHTRGGNIHMCLNPMSLVKMTYIHDKSGEFITRMLYKGNQEDYKKNYPFATFEDVQVKCGKCFECLNEYSREWSFRCVAEAKMHDKNCFITLTYRNNPVQLIKRDLQLFLKRLRKHLEPQKIRYFACGEYGSKRQRPHFHLIIFGWCPDDLEFFFYSGDEKIYKSKTLDKIWSLGFVSVGEVSLKSCKYCAKYLQKLVNYDGLVKPFVTMSLKPGIGLDYFKQHQNFLRTDEFIINGEFCRIPRYFLEYSRRNYFFNQDDLKEKRAIRGRLKRFDKNKIKKINAFLLHP